MCGICGVVAEHTEDLIETLLYATDYFFLRGHDAAGVVLINSKSRDIRQHKKVRLPRSHDRPVDNEFRRIVGEYAHEIDADMGISQTKFTTSEKSRDRDIIYLNTQPTCLSYDEGADISIAAVHNGEIDAEPLKGQITHSSSSAATVDSRYLTEIYYQKLLEFGDSYEAAKWIIENVDGSFAFGVSDEDGLLFFKDKWGNRPLSFGIKKGRGHIKIVASEDSLFSRGALNVENYGEVGGGEAIELRPDKDFKKKGIVEWEDKRPCKFEDQYLKNYYASCYGGEKTVSRYRMDVARDVFRLYEDRFDELDIDVFTGLPRSGISYGEGAIEPAKNTRMRYVSDIIRKPPLKGGVRFYVGDHMDNFREFDFNRQLVQELAHDINRPPNLALFDDSNVSGKTGAELYVEWKIAGGGTLALVSCWGPMIRVCPYGVGFPKQEKLITYKLIEMGIIDYKERGEIDYDIEQINCEITKLMREKALETAREKYKIDIDVSDFYVFYGTRDIIRKNTPYKPCDYCEGGIGLY